MSRSIGFIGLGIMGASMALRLIQAGHRVTVYNRTVSRTAPLAAAGGRVAVTPREAAQGNDIVISIVSDTPDVEEVLLGPAGAVHGAAPGAVFIDMSTIAPEAARKIGLTLKAKGIPFLDAPVTGGDVGAREGTLSILVGGDAEPLARVKDILEIMGRRITHCGPSGAGQTVKACNQILCALNLLGVSEAIQLARHGGIDPSIVLEALVPGAGGSWSLEKLGPRIARGDFAPGFKIKLMQKDLRIVQATAAALGLSLEGTSLAQGILARNEAHGEADLGTHAMYKELERDV